MHGNTGECIQRQWPRSKELRKGQALKLKLTQPAEWGIPIAVKCDFLTVKEIGKDGTL